MTRAKDQLYFVSDEINESEFLHKLSKNWHPIKQPNDLLISKSPLESTRK